jgi:hypothetical protein
MSYKKILNAVLDDHSSYNKDVLDENKRKDLPEIIILYPGELLKQYRERRSYKG